MKHTILIIAITLLISNTTFSQNPSLQYLNQEPPDLSPRMFAPELVSLKDQYEYGSAFSHDGKELYFAVDLGGRAEIRCIRVKENKWTKPETLVSSEKYSYNDPFLSSDQNRLFFISDMPLDGLGEKKDYDIWYIERMGSKWSRPINAGKTINSDKNEYYISFTSNGTMYFSSNAKTTEDNKRNFDIYASENRKGIFQEPIRLGDSVNTQGYEADVFIAYDESYLIFCGGRPDGYGKGDLYISFKKEDGAWTAARNMGKEINTEEHELCPFVSRDGKYLFYTSNKDIYWVDARIINRMR
jgi:hypothetical protein